MTTYRYGVIISGVAGSYVPHRLRQHTDVNQAIGVATNDVLAWDGTEWTPKGTDELPAGTHNHTGVYATPADLAAYAPLVGADFVDRVTVSGAAPEILFDEVSGAGGQRIYVDGNTYFFNSDSRNVFKLERYYSSYNFMSMGNQYREFTTSGTVGNPACVVYVDATAGNIVLTLNAVADYYRSNTYYYSGAWLIFVRKDATANTVTITPNGAETIDGAATLVMSGLDSMVFMQAAVGGWKVINRKDSTLDSSDSGWANLTLGGAWSAATRPSGYTYSVPGYRKVNKLVTVRGGAQTSSTTSSQTLATLPEGYRPAADLTIPTVGYTTGSGSGFESAWVVKADGTILRAMGSGNPDNAHLNFSFYVD